MKKTIPVIFALLIGAIAGHYGTKLDQTSNSQEVWDVHFIGLMDELTDIITIKEGDLEQALSLSNLSALHHLTAIRKLDDSLGDKNITPVDAKARVLKAIYLEWENQDPFDDILNGDESSGWLLDWKKDFELNMLYLESAHKQCMLHKEYDCKTSRGRRGTKT